MNEQRSKQNKSGQSFLEFVLLLFIMVSFGFLLLKGLNSGIGSLWEKYIRAIAAPTDIAIELN